MSEKIRTAGTEPKTLPCHVVKDLLPLYVDGLTSEETSADICAHLAECDDCRKEYEAMTGQFLPEQKAQQEQETKEIDYLKKLKRSRMRTALIITGIITLILGVAHYSSFIKGHPDENAEISAIVSEGNKVHIQAGLSPSSEEAVAGVRYSEQDGVVTVTLNSCRKGIKRDDVLVDTYIAKSDVKQVIDTGGHIIWENGAPIEYHVSRLFSKKVQYIGNAPAISQLVQNVWFAGVDLQLKDGIQLKTDAKPYTLILKTEAIDNQTLAVQHKHAILLLALIENLDRVEYMYEDPSYQAAIPLMVNSMDSASALEWARKLAMYGGSHSAEMVRNADSIKDFGKSASALQALVDVLEKDSDTFYSIVNEEFLRAMMKLELKLDDLSVATESSSVRDAEGTRTVTVDFSNGSVLTWVCRRDGQMISASYLDKAAGLLYEYEEGQEGIRISDL